MNDIKKWMCIIIFMPVIMHAQGIKWANGLSWEQVKQKAKAENKYIFVDAYATWCGPCKMMDQNVYPNDTVGNLFNEHFIAVKVQMDKTEKDDQKIKDWYDAAEMLKKEFAVQAFPSFIFLSPDANIIQKEMGFRKVQDFVSIAKEALVPEKINNNPFREYKILVDDYKQGIKHYDRMPFMINRALEFNDPDLARKLLLEHIEYAATINENERYTKENIEVWSKYILRIDSKATGFFLNDGDKIDKVMNRKGHSKDMVDKTIQAKIVDSFFRMQKGETTTMDGKKIPNSEIMFVQLPLRFDGKIQPDFVEADWKNLEKMILEHFSKDYMTRNLLVAKMRWYKQHQNEETLVKLYFNQFLKKYPSSDLKRDAQTININSWETFLYFNDKKLLNKALLWMMKLMQLEPPVEGYIDTYANLLYKLNRTKEAISWEEKALGLIPKDDYWNQKPGYQLALDQMKKGEPTYQHQGAIWKK